ncbi:MAG: hypothetical protein IJV35_00740 [Neisseriaceae bacterium]|nr:hypothetical protein [Neisseriaceae bacterium]
MKTVQQYLNELDTQKLMDTYFYHHPIEYDNKKVKLDLTVREIKKVCHKNLRKYIKRLRNLTITPPKDNKQGVLFVHRYIKDDIHQELFSLVYLDELLEQGEKAQSYAYEWTKQSEIMGFFVADTPLTQHHIYDLMADVMWEASFFGYKQEYLAKEKKRLKKSMKEAKKGKTKSFSMEEFEKKFGITELDKESPDEEELHNIISQAERAYSDHSYKKELNLIKEKLSGSLKAE